ncbi:hypothetical protein CEXT_375781 [Caerostris extrusa]|uniref:Uncharacterized protein n=1 Tax=Caerostris extrusa TaxID=172846 RepID=A0AAV4QK26_CAEEX|nr:hypothetical protein CEXT_375781 [Caerostris extrusa]
MRVIHEKSLIFFKTQSSEKPFQDLSNISLQISQSQETPLKTLQKSIVFSAKIFRIAKEYMFDFPLDLLFPILPEGRKHKRHPEEKELSYRWNSASLCLNRCRCASGAQASLPGLLTLSSAN